MYKFIENKLTASDVENKITNSFYFSENNFIVEVKYCIPSLRTKITFTIYWHNIIVFRILKIKSKVELKDFIKKNMKVFHYYKKINTDILDSIISIISQITINNKRDSDKPFYYEKLYYLKKDGEHLIRNKINSASSILSETYLFKHDGKLSLQYVFNEHFNLDLEHFCNIFNFNKIKNIPFEGNFDSSCTGEQYTIIIRNINTKIDFKITSIKSNFIYIDIISIDYGVTKRIRKEFNIEKSLGFDILQTIVEPFLLNHFISESYLKSIDMAYPLSTEQIEHIKLLNY